MKELNIKAVLEECLSEISRINKAAGETIFNPAVTDLIRTAIAEVSVNEAYPGIAHDLNTALLALERIAKLDPIIDSEEWDEESAKADYFVLAQILAKGALAKIKG